MESDTSLEQSNIFARATSYNEKEDEPNIEELVKAKIKELIGDPLTEMHNRTDEMITELKAMKEKMAELKEKTD